MSGDMTVVTYDQHKTTVLAFNRAARPMTSGMVGCLADAARVRCNAGLRTRRLHMAHACAVLRCPLRSAQVHMMMPGKEAHSW